MKAGRRFVLVLVTAPDLKSARALARAALASRLAACVNLLPGIESHYRWQGKVESSSEVLLLLKTTRPRLVALKQLILAKHPYDTPEFVALSLDSGSKRYLDWLAASVK
jgi:periplasmic divalent cation tolerance protein